MQWEKQEVGVYTDPNLTKKNVSNAYAVGSSVLKAASKKKKMEKYPSTMITVKDVVSVLQNAKLKQ